jgi:hypothetical protein
VHVLAKTPQVVEPPPNCNSRVALLRISSDSDWYCSERAILQWNERPVMRIVGGFVSFRIQVNMYQYELILVYKDPVHFYYLQLSATRILSLIFSKNRRYVWADSELKARCGYFRFQENRTKMIYSFSRLLAMSLSCYIYHETEFLACNVIALNTV